MDRKYYTGEQILDALFEVGVGAGDISEVMSCLGRMQSAESEITYCKDCKHRFLQNGIWQCPFTIPASENHFCGYAERRTDETD